ncbi:MAG: outer membrane beta-barrel protein, partial [Myxococcota bacterium]
MLSRQITAVGTAVLLLSTSAAAQTARWEFGTFGNYTNFGDLVQLEDKLGAGGRLGFFLLRRIELEAATSVTSTTGTSALIGDVTYLPVRGRLLYNQPMFGGLALLFGASYFRNQYSTAGTSSSDTGVGGLLGLRLNLSRRFALRVDGTMDYFNVTGAATTTSERNLGLEAGLSL